MTCNTTAATVTYGDKGKFFKEVLVAGSRDSVKCI